MVVIASPIQGFPREPANLMFLWHRLRLRWAKASGHSGLWQDAEQTRLTEPVNQQIQDGRDYRIPVSTNINFLYVPMSRELEDIYGS